MRRHRVSSALLIGAAGLALVTEPAAGQVQVAPPPPPPAPAPATAPIPAVGQRPAEAIGLDGIMVPVVPPLFGREIAGLPQQAPAESLTWRRVYELAVIRARSGGTGRAESLDPGILAEQSRRHGVADFARFRKEFLAGRTEAGAAFHDPSEAYFGLLRRVAAIESGRRQVATLENLLKLLQELIQGESAGLSQLHVDLVNETLTRARRGFWREVAGFRDDLDALKVALGLSPHAAVLSDIGEVAAFGRVWDAVAAWQRRPDRNLAELPRILEGLPVPGDAIVGGRPILRAIEQSPDRMESTLREVTLLAVKNRSRPDGPGATEDDVALELKVRRRIRRLLEGRREYQEQKRSYELAVRLQDQAFERVIQSTSGRGTSPLVASASATTLVNLITPIGRAREAQDRLAATWADFRAERLALYRDLGVLPYDNWDAFYADLAADHATR